MIELKCLNAADLEAFVASAEFQNMEHLPISVHRGISHARNPRALADDVLLILAYENSQMVGYLGILPDRLHFGTAAPEHCGWLSCIWVDLRMRGKGISKTLVRKALELYDERILITEFTGPAKRLYAKIGAFMPLQSKEGLRLYQRLDLQKILPAKGGMLSKLKPLWQVADVLGNAVLDLRFLFRSASLPGLKLEYITEIDAETEAFIAARQGQQLFRRGPAELNWMTGHPWIIAGNPNSEMAKRYAFSSVDSRFEFVQVKVRDEQDKLLAYMMLARRGDGLKVNYCYCDTADYGIALKVLRHHLDKWKIKTAVIYQASLLAAMKKNGTGALYKKQALRQYEIGKVFADQLAGREVEIQDGDGDCGFT